MLSRVSRPRQSRPVCLPKNAPCILIMRKLGHTILPAFPSHTEIERMSCCCGALLTNGAVIKKMQLVLYCGD